MNDQQLAQELLNWASGKKDIKGVVKGVVP